MRHSELKKKIETPVLLTHAIEDSTDIFGIWGAELNPPNPLGTPLIVTTHYKVKFRHRINIKSQFFMWK